MTSNELRKKFLNFFSAKGGPATGGKHVVVPSSSLLPDDPSVLLTSAGMQQFKPYYTGQADYMTSPHPALGGKPIGSKNVVSIQKSFRTSDIDEIGDETHLTFFEMMGNFSFGGYFKEEAIKLAYELLISNFQLPISKMSVTVFGGDDKVPKDEESVKIWNSLGFFEEKGNLRFAGQEDNFWGPTGSEGPCGPTTEVYIDGVEIWNIVFNEFYCGADKKLELLKTPGVDTGMGLERLAMVAQNKANIFETDLFKAFLDLIPKEVPIAARRIIVDHIRGTVFLLSEGVRPSNKEAGYILRRLIRRVVLYEKRYELSENMFSDMILAIIKYYGNFYIELIKNREIIHEEFQKEQDKFRKLLIGGLKRIQEIIKKKQDSMAVEVGEGFGERSEHYIDLISGQEAFDVYQSYGIPPELIQEELAQSGYGYHEKEFEQAFEEEKKKHQEISRAGREKKFGGHGLILDTGELKAANEEELKIATRLHTATHLLQAGLRKVLGDTVRQAGSDITAERLRFDFTFARKLTPEEINNLEVWVNDAIKRNLDVRYVEMPYEEAIKTDALCFRKEKYPSVVRVYSAVDPKTGEIFSKELCGGPHVEHTAELGHFKITKEESVSAGVRRIRAIVE